MKRKIALTAAVLALGAIAFMGWRVWRGAAAKRATAERIQSLPAFEAHALGGQVFSESDFATGENGGQPLVLIYFRTKCPFCQSETESIKQHDALRQAAPVVMVSPESRNTLLKFKKEYGLAGVSGVRLARDSDGNIAETFGVGAVPATFVYDTGGQLLKHFQGEASAKAIYAALRSGGAKTNAGAVADRITTGPGGCAMSESLTRTTSDDKTSDCLPSEN